MPLPDWLRGVNRVATNPVLGMLAGRVRPFARVLHTGRRTGRRYSTPLWAFEQEGTIAIALTYGDHVDWARNLLAGGEGSIDLGGQTSRLVDPRLVGDEEGRRFMPVPVRGALSMLGVHGYLLAERG